MKCYKGGLFILCYLMFVTSFGQTHKSIFKKGQEAYNQSNYKEALNLFNQAIAKNKSKTPISFQSKVVYTHWRGATFCRIGRYEEALKDLTFCIKNRKEFQQQEDLTRTWVPVINSSDYYWRGYAHFHLKNYLSSIDDLDQSIRVDPNSLWSHVYKGESLLALGKYPEANKSFTQAILNGNETAFVYSSKGRTYYKMKDYNESLKNYQKAYEKEPNTLSHLASTAMPLAHMGQYDQSLEALEKVISQDNSNPYYLFMKARVHGIFNKRHEAIQSMEAAFKEGFEDWDSFATYFNDFGSLKSDPRFLQLLIENNAMVGVMQSSGNKDLLANLTSQKARNVTYIEIVQSEENSDSEVAASNTTSDYEHKYALVIGNSNYGKAPLKNAVNDALLMSSELKSSGFDVIDYYDLSRADLRKAIRDFGDKIKDQEGVALFYYAGHGLQSGGSNFLVPVEADIQYDYEIEDACVNMNHILRMMQEFNSQMNIVILDACRNNPFGSASRSTSQKGLAKPEIAPTGTIIAFATAPGSTASDGDGSNGLYTSELVKAMRIKGLTIEEVFKQVRINVLKLSDQQQNPWENSSLVGDFYFRR
ncbi:MAG: caspase family protein [Bacteroidota bacterium]